MKYKLITSKTDTKSLINPSIKSTEAQNQEIKGRPPMTSIRSPGELYSLPLDKF